MSGDIARRFISSCLEMQWNVTADERVRRLAEDAELDWDAVRRVANAEELAPLLYHLIRDRGIVPADLERELSVAYYSTAAQNALRLDDLEKVLGLLAAQGVSAILLKGAALIETLYSNAAVRPMEDIDLMVRPESLPIAIQVLSEFCDALSSSESQIHGLVEQEREITFQKTGETNTLFDLHWQALDSPFYLHTLFTNWLWESARPLEVGDNQAMTLGPEGLLLQLCGHYLIDKSRKELLWLYDIASAISKYRSTIDWSLVIDKARMYGLMLPVKQVISRIGNEWKTLVSREVAERIDRLSVPHAEMVFYDWASSKDRAVVRLVGVNLSSMPSWRERLGYIVSNILPPISYMQHRYEIRNPVWVLLTYPYRWLLSLYRAIIR